MHHPLNLHCTVSLTNMRPNPNLDYNNNRGGTIVIMSCGNSHGQSLTISRSGLVDFISQIINEIVNNRSGVHRVSPPTPFPQPVVPSKRPREREQRITAFASSAHAVRPAVRNAVSIMILIFRIAPPVHRSFLCIRWHLLHPIDTLAVID